MARLRQELSQNSPRSELAAALAACRTAFVGIFLFSGMIGILALTSTFFVLEIYDRVVPSRSFATLIGLSVLAAVLFMFLGVLDFIRGRVFVRIAAYLDEALGHRIYDATVRLPLIAPRAGDGLQSLRDLDQVRSFLAGGGPAALFDAPFLFLFIFVSFLFHAWLGLAVLLGALILIALTLLTESLVREPTRTATAHLSQRYAVLEASRRNAEILRAMGMTGRLFGVWSAANRKYMESLQRANDLAASLGGISRVFRMMLQSAILAIGAYLVIEQQASGGIIFAAAVLVGRAFAPIDLAIGNWNGFVAARQSWHRLNEMLKLVPIQSPPMTLPRPSKSISVENLSVVPPGSRRAVVQDVTFSLKGGNGLGIVGPSAAGKSSLARALVGVWAPARGQIRIDGAALDQWAPELLGPHVGYLPQDVELLAGTVAQNISRFDPERSSDPVIAAARAAGIHEMVLRLPGGYDTEIGEGGAALSAGQRQRIALARALYGDPFLLVLDEPNSNLDADGERALTQAILATRARGAIVVTIAHRLSSLQGVDLLLELVDGKLQAFGPKDEVLRKIVRPVAVPAERKAAGEVKL